MDGGCALCVCSLLINWDCKSVSPAEFSTAVFTVDIFHSTLYTPVCFWWTHYKNVKTRPRVTITTNYVYQYTHDVSGVNRKRMGNFDEKNKWNGLWIEFVWMSWPNAWRRPFDFDGQVNTYRSHFNLLLLLWLWLAAAACCLLLAVLSVFPNRFLFSIDPHSHSPHSILSGSNLFLHSARLT